MLPVLQVGPFALQVPGLILLVGLWAGLSLAERHAPRFNLDAEKVYNLAFAMLIGGLMGARLVYVARYPSAFSASPLNILSPNPGLLDAWGGAAAALIAGLIYGQRKRLAFWPTLDALTPALAVMAVASALANLASGGGFGAPTDLPWGVELWGASRHPTQIYEALAAGVILWLVWPSRQTDGQKTGIWFLRFAALSAGARLFFEAFRGDSALILGGLRAAQMAAWALLAASLWGIAHLQKAKSD